jgi:hypothetical protein
MALRDPLQSCRRMRLPIEWSMQRELVWSWRAYWQSIAHHRSTYTYGHRVTALRKARRSELAALRARKAIGLKP